jgi:hypothetical protein
MNLRELPEFEKESGMMRHGKTMASETERGRLTRIYADMSDEALLEMAADRQSLTDIANEVLSAELSARNLHAPEVVSSVEVTKDEEEAYIQEEVTVPYSGPLVMVKRFRDLPEAFVAKSILESAKIDCFLADENMVRIDWFISNLLGGTKLMVRPEDAETALALLNESENEINAARQFDMNSTQSDSGEEQK